MFLLKGVLSDYTDLSRVEYWTNKKRLFQIFKRDNTVFKLSLANKIIRHEKVKLQTLSLTLRKSFINYIFINYHDNCLYEKFINYICVNYHDNCLYENLG